MTTAAVAPSRARGGLRLDRDDLTVRWLVAGFALFFAIALVIPLYMLISRSFFDRNGDFIGFANYREYFDTPALFQSIQNSFTVAGISTAIVIVLAFAYAYALNRTCMRFKGFFKVIAMVPLLSPSLLKAIALVYWFGKQGVLADLMFGHSIYGPIGIVMASVFWTFPHAVLIIGTALALSDTRLYEAAEVLKTRPSRVFFTVTLPGARYGIISAVIVVFILVLTDFGVPKVIGGSYNVMATDIYKEVIGQQNFEMGAVVSVILLIPAVIAFAIDRIVTRKAVAQLSARAVPYAPKPNRLVDNAMLVYCLVITVLTLAILGMAQYAALVKFWPYNLELTLEHFSFEVQGAGWDNFYNSLKVAVSVSVIGTFLIFIGAYVVEKPRRDSIARQAIQMMALLPMAVPGLVLGLAYLMFVNHPSNPLGFLYGTITIIVLSTITHFYTVTHLTAATALKQMDREFESVSASLKVPLARSFWRVTMPVCMPAIFDISIYLFLNSMTTVSAVIFLYGPATKVASVAAIHLDDSGETAAAAAMAMLIVYACVVVRVLHVIVTGRLLYRLQAWRRR